MPVLGYDTTLLLFGQVPGIEVVSTNPCLRGSMRVLTKQGLIPIAELDGKESEIYLGNNL